MATGLINPTIFVNMPGLSARTTNAMAQCYTPYKYPLRDVGYVVQDRPLAVFLWNGSTGDLTLAGIIGNEAAAGITWDAMPPEAIPARTSLRITITVGVEGPMEYEALLTFLSLCAFDPFLLIIGTRAPQLSGDVGYLFFPHNWENGLDESLAWKTDVLIAHDRTEQRIQLRTLPRRSWDLRMLVAGAARRKLETWLGLRKTRYLFAPVWRDAEILQVPVTAGESTIPISPQFLDYAVERWVAIFDEWNHFEIRTVAGVGANFISVDAPFEQDWPVGTMVAPCRYGLCLEQRRVSRFTEEVGEYRVSFETLNETLMPAMESPDLYREIPVCPIVPSWEGPEEAWDNKWVRLDNDTGWVEYDLQSIEPAMTREATFLLIGRSTIDRFLRFLFARAGRLAPFWLAANDRSFELASPADQGDGMLTITNIDYEYALQGSPARSHVELITTDGTVIRRRITAVETLPSGDEQLILDLALPVAVSSASLNRSAWLELVRLDSDEIKLHWVSGECVQVTVPIAVLP